MHTQTLTKRSTSEQRRRSCVGSSAKVRVVENAGQRQYVMGFCPTTISRRSTSCAANLMSSSPENIDSSDCASNEAPTVSVTAASCVAMVLVVTLVVLVYPGLYSPDTVLIVWQGRGQAPRTSWHPQALVEIWGLIDQISGSASTIWLAQTALFGVGAFLLVRLARRKSGASTAVVVLMLPPVLAMVISVWKDTQLGLVWLILGCLAVRYEGERRQMIGLLACALSVAVIRYNSPFLALLPLVLVIETERHRLRPAWPRFSTALIAVAGIVTLGAAGLLSGLLVSARSVHPENVSMAWDIVGAGLRSGHIDLPAPAQRVPECTTDEYRSQYNPATSDFLVFPEEACVDLVLAEEYDEQLAGPTSRISLADWLGALSNSPGGYLEHRVAVTANLLGLEGVPAGTAYYTNPPSAGSFVDVEPRPLSAEVFRFVRWSTRSLGLLYLPIVWLAVSILGLFFINDSVRRRRATLIVGTVVVNLAVTAILTPAGDLRYSFPLLTTAMVVITLAADRSPSNVHRRLVAGSDPGGARVSSEPDSSLHQEGEWMFLGTPHLSAGTMRSGAGSGSSLFGPAPTAESEIERMSLLNAPCTARFGTHTSRITLCTHAMMSWWSGWFPSPRPRVRTYSPSSTSGHAMSNVR